MTEAEFVRTYGEQVPCIYRYCQFRTNSRSDAEDLTAETFARLLAHSQKLAASEAPPWLFTVARNLCTDVLRTRDRHVPLNKEAEERSEPVFEITWHDSSVWQALRSLGPSEQSIVYLRAIEDQPFARVAILTGKRVGAVKVAYGRAIRRLERALTEGV